MLCLLYIFAKEQKEKRRLRQFDSLFRDIARELNLIKKSLNNHSRQISNELEKEPPTIDKNALKKDIKTQTTNMLNSIIRDVADSINNLEQHFNQLKDDYGIKIADIEKHLGVYVDAKNDKPSTPEALVKELHYQGKSPQEIATQLGIPLGEVTFRLKMLQ